MRRFTRLTNAFSKKLVNHTAMVALYMYHYNFIKPHRSLKNATPAMAAGIADWRREYADAEPVGGELHPARDAVP